MEKKKIYMIYSDMKLQNLNVQGKLCADSNKLQEWKTWCSIFVKKKKLRTLNLKFFFVFTCKKHTWIFTCMHTKICMTTLSVKIWIDLLWRIRKYALVTVTRRDLVLLSLLSRHALCCFFLNIVYYSIQQAISEQVHVTHMRKLLQHCGD